MKKAASLGQVTTGLALPMLQRPSDHVEVMATF
jgi:hypothetical protein